MELFQCVETGDDAPSIDYSATGYNNITCPGEHILCKVLLIDWYSKYQFELPIDKAYT